MSRFHTEWDLLVIAEGIEPGDTIDVEDGTGITQPMIFDRLTRSVILIDFEGSARYFSPTTLEEKDGECMVVGKSEKQISRAELLKNKEKREKK